ncbi:hypothetical protein SAMN04487905_102204 [Actinopolyspora xinjiangensis]|uniref:Secreted protein n=2 Tax=Actinopolyspora xinjiangensis TaxID=405564 RepID=A0A1H0QEP6_9ACTN|nr:hypothetical protein SAMN04487905_102204 [Actinopolyspora xinjiangensis]
MPHRTRLAGLGAIVAALTSSGFIATQVATAQQDTEKPPPIVEDYSYPGAAQIEDETGVKLIEGDGNIIKVGCDKDTPLIRVDSANTSIDRSCYEVIDAHGWLTMEIPNVYSIRGDDHTVNATVTSNGQSEQVVIPSGKTTAIGIGNGADEDPAALVELRVPK